MLRVTSRKVVRWKLHVPAHLWRGVWPSLCRCLPVISMTVHSSNEQLTECSGQEALTLLTSCSTQNHGGGHLGRNRYQPHFDVRKQAPRGADMPSAPVRGYQPQVDAALKISNMTADKVWVWGRCSPLQVCGYLQHTCKQHSRIDKTQQKKG